MSKLVCASCGAVQTRWLGRCPACGEWSSLREEAPARRGVIGAIGARSPAAPLTLAEISPAGSAPMPTGLAEVDRVLAGGLVPGSATLLGGEPGTGKSTLLLQVLASMASSGRRCLLVAAEEAAHQVRRRAMRLRADVAPLLVSEATQLDAVEAALSTVAADVAVVDSVQAVSEAGSPAGSPAQVRECANRLVALAKGLGTALVLVGHVTKDGALAGPRALEHLVDTVLSFEGDRFSSLRALRSVKHRFGPTGETGLFEMAEHGLVGVADPSSLFLGDRRDSVPGSAVAAPVEGHRPLMVEVQALVGRPSQVPRRYVTGLDAGRVGFLVAVLDRYAGLQVGNLDLYVSVAGGAKACEPAADLAVCLAIASCLIGRPVPSGMVAIGEVGLGGELRRVSAMAKRLAEARRMGFMEALVPSVRHGGPLAGDTRVRGAATLRRALMLALGELPAGCGAGTEPARRLTVVRATHVR